VQKISFKKTAFSRANNQQLAAGDKMPDCNAKRREPVALSENPTAIIGRNLTMLIPLIEKAGKYCRSPFIMPTKRGI